MRRPHSHAMRAAGRYGSAHSGASSADAPTAIATRIPINLAIVRPIWPTQAEGRMSP